MWVTLHLSFTCCVRFAKGFYYLKMSLTLNQLALCNKPNQRFIISKFHFHSYPKMGNSLYSDFIDIENFTLNTLTKYLQSRRLPICAHSPCNIILQTPSVSIVNDMGVINRFLFNQQRLLAWLANDYVYSCHTFSCWWYNHASWRRDIGTGSHGVTWFSTCYVHTPIHTLIYTPFMFSCH